MRHRHWLRLLEKLKNRELPTEQIGPTIVRLGKPFAEARILAARDVVASYLDHPDFYVRREAMWFLTSWGRLREYGSHLLDALNRDPDVDNRGFAASYLGVLYRGTRDPEVVAALAHTIGDTSVDELVRLSAYGALLDISGRESGLAFQARQKDLSDIDWQWVRTLSAGGPSDNAGGVEEH